MDSPPDLKEQILLQSAGKCTFCRQKINREEFKNEKSRREFKISGLCQNCQEDKL